MPDVWSTTVEVPLTGPQAVSATTAMVWHPPEDRGLVAVVLAPGAGGSVADDVLGLVARELVVRGHPTVIFQFAYTEAGRRRPDPMSRCEAAFRDVVDAARADLVGPRPVVVGGRSMGGRTASHLVADPDWPAANECSGLLLLGYPLHPARRVSDKGVVPPERLRTSHWPGIDRPTLFVHGDRDLLCDPETFKSEAEHLLDPTRTTVHVVAGADHAFSTRRRDGRTAEQARAEVAQVVGRWIDALLQPARSGPA